MIEVMVKAKQQSTSKAVISIQPRPFLKWVGGKARLIPQLEVHYPESYNKYYEPFVGGGAMFFSVNPTVGHINDMNSVLISAYQHIRDDVDKLIAHLATIQDYYLLLPDIDAKKEFYLEKRAEFNSLENTSFEKTVLLIFLNKTCFNGMYRENSKGGFNVPFGKQATPTICDAINLKNISLALQKTTITCSSYEHAIEGAGEGDFVYLDPPYHPLNATSSFTSYQADGFTAEDQEKLRDKFAELAKRGCKVMLSNSDSPLINELYKDFNIHKVYAARSINATGTGRGKITEVLVTSY